MSNKKENTNVTTGINEAIETFVVSQLPPVQLLSNDVINTSGIDDIRLDALREKGIRSFKGTEDIIITYVNGLELRVNGALATAALIAGVTVTNLAESLCKGKFSKYGKEIILPNDQVRIINDARIEAHKRDVAELSINLNNYINTAGITFTPADLPLYYTLYQHSLVCGADNAGIWVSYPGDKLPEEFGLLSLEVIKGRVSYEHRVTLAEQPIVL